MAPRTTWTSRPNGRISSTPSGRTQWAGVPVPEVGSQPSVTANKRMPVIATQKSGLAPASEITLAVRSKAPPGR